MNEVINELIAQFMIIIQFFKVTSFVSVYGSFEVFLISVLYEKRYNFNSLMCKPNKENNVNREQTKLVPE